MMRHVTIGIAIILLLELLILRITIEATRVTTADRVWRTAAVERMESKLKSLDERVSKIDVLIQELKKAPSTE